MRQKEYAFEGGKEKGRKGEEEEEGKGEVSNTALGLHQTALPISDPDGERSPGSLPFPC